MPEIEITPEQEERLRALQEDIARDVVGKYGHVRPRDAVEYLLDRYEDDGEPAKGEAEATPGDAGTTAATPATINAATRAPWVGMNAISGATVNPNSDVTVNPGPNCAHRPPQSAPISGRFNTPPRTPTSAVAFEAGWAIISRIESSGTIRHLPRRR